VLNSQDITHLPYGNMNPFLLQAMAAGMSFAGSLQPDNNRALDHASTANYNSGGLGTGLSEFLLDGNPVTGTNGGRAGYVPLSEAVDEVRRRSTPPWATPSAPSSALPRKRAATIFMGRATGRCSSSAGTPPRTTRG
jgi:hypothetical protein